MKYEIELAYFPDHWFESEIATLTGLEFEEIYEITKNVKRWSGSQYVKVFQKLGFNCNNRFIKFDKDTPYPCIMRCSKIRVKESHWYGFIYYDGNIYIPNYGTLTWAQWNSFYPNYKVTSMLQVWI